MLNILTLRTFFPLSPLHVLFPILFFLCTLIILLMSDPFRIEPTGKSWADIVEEEEEYNRMHPDDELSESVLHLDANPSISTTTSKESDSTNEVKQTQNKETHQDLKSEDMLEDNLSTKKHSGKIIIG